MNRDTERLLYAAQHPGPNNQEPPPAFLGWIFIVLGAVFFLAGVTMAICILIAGRCLSRRKRYSFALVIACIECLFVPFGTILGVFTIVALSRDSEGIVLRRTNTSTAVTSTRPPMAYELRPPSAV
jgi:hypothetical protein